jgi:hypothetical protein
MAGDSPGMIPPLLVCVDVDYRADVAVAAGRWDAVDALGIVVHRAGA